MISMTGFGRAVVSVGVRRVAVEVRSVNHRGLEVKVRGRGLSAAAEVDAIRFVRTRCTRGAVQVSIDSIDDERDVSAVDDLDDLSPTRLQALHARLENLRLTLGGLDGKVIDLFTLQAFVRLERERAHTGSTAAAPLTWDEVRPALAEALSQLAEFRATEGSSLAAELEIRGAHLGHLVNEVRARLPDSALRARQRLGDRLNALMTTLGGAGTGIDPGRLAQEAAILIDRLDVSEEMARLDAHLTRLTELLRGTSGPSQGDKSSGEGVGRPLEFLLQEIGRELNTLGTKAQDADISALVISGKAELEKIREQAQNIE